MFQSGQDSRGFWSPVLVNCLIVSMNRYQLNATCNNRIVNGYYGNKLRKFVFRKESDLFSRLFQRRFRRKPEQLTYLVLMYDAQIVITVIGKVHDPRCAKSRFGKNMGAYSTPVTQICDLSSRKLFS